LKLALLESYPNAFTASVEIQLADNLASSKFQILTQTNTSGPDIFLTPSPTTTHCELNIFMTIITLKLYQVSLSELDLVQFFSLILLREYICALTHLGNFYCIPRWKFLNIPTDARDFIKS